MPNYNDSSINIVNHNSGAPNNVTTQYFHDSGGDITLSALSPEKLQNRFPENLPAFYYAFDTNLAGVHVHANGVGSVGIGEGQTSFSVWLPCKTNFASDDQIGYYITSSGITRTDTDAYGAYFTGSSYQQSYNEYQAFLSGAGKASGYTGTQQFSGSDFKKSVYSCSVSKAGVNPLVGNAESLQAQMVENGLDFTTPTVSEEDAAWGVGGRIGRVTYGGSSGMQYDVRINHAWRIFEGGRSLLVVDLPLSYRDIHGAQQWRGFGAISLAVPMSRTWTLQPRFAYGFASGKQEQIKGKMLDASITSLLQFPHVGRGSITLGGMAGFTKVTTLSFAGQSVDDLTSNWSLRGGGAYELPLKTRIAGRMASIRASYAYTHYFGDQIYTPMLHEFTLSMGVRSRGSDARNGFEIFRIGAEGKFGRNYNGVHIFVGYRF